MPEPGKESMKTVAEYNCRPLEERKLVKAERGHSRKEGKWNVHCRARRRGRTRRRHGAAGIVKRSACPGPTGDS